MKTRKEIEAVINKVSNYLFLAHSSLYEINNPLSSHSPFDVCNCELAKTARELRATLEEGQ